MELTTKHHAEIFKGYLDRIALSDLRQILIAVEGCWHEQMNGNAGSQLHADKKLADTVRKSLDSILQSDLANLETITRRLYQNA